MQKTLTGAVREAFIKSYPPHKRHENVVLCIGDIRLSGDDSLGDLDTFDDRLIVLQAVLIPPPEVAAHTFMGTTGYVEPYAPSHSFHDSARHPLQPVNRQLTVPPPTSPSERVKKERSPSSTPSKRAPSFPEPTLPGVDRTPRRSGPHQEGSTPLPLRQAAEPTPSSQPRPPSSPSPQEDESQYLYELRAHENPFQQQDDEAVDHPIRGEPLRQLTEETSPLRLEASVKAGIEVLAELETPLRQLQSNIDAGSFLQQIASVRKEAAQTRTVVGVVGNTGAGKSSVINAMLEEERLVPTNCMRACTAVVTELSYNNSRLENQKYRAEIEFISPEEWQKELEVLFSEAFDESGRLHSDTRDPESQASIGYAKMRAVYNKYTKDMLVGSSVSCGRI